MQVSYKNLIIEFNQVDDEMIGGALLTIPSEYVERFLSDVENCEYGVDEIEYYFEEQDCEIDVQEFNIPFETRNSDFQIIFMSWAMEQDEEIHFDYEGDNIFWLYHDFNHAIYDVTGTEIYVDGYIEAERCYQAISLLKERNEMNNITIHTLATIYKEFQERGKNQTSFKDAFDFDKALKLADIEEEINFHCNMCGCENEPEITENEDAEEYETHECSECGYLAELESFQEKESDFILQY